MNNIIMPSGTYCIPFDKKLDIYQVDCQLFSTCNLNCKFCFQHTNNNIDIDYILNIPSNVFPYIIQKKKELNFHLLKIYSWGGEVFGDFVKDQIFQAYKNYIKSFTKLCEQNLQNTKIEFTWTSNGVFLNRKRIQNFLKQTNSIIAFSYDPLYRYSSEQQKNIALNNFRYFKKYTDCIGFTIIKQLINPSLLENDPVFSKQSRFNDFSLDLNYYIGSSNYSQFLPNDEEMFEFYKWLIDNQKFNVIAIQQILLNYFNNYNSRFCICKFTSQYIKNTFTTKCSCNSDYSDDYFYGKYTKQMTEQNCNELRNYMAITKRNCLNCRYYHICPMFCHITQMFKYIKITVCPLYKIFQYISKNQKQIKNNYQKYIQKNRSF